MCPLDPALLAPPYARFNVRPELADDYIHLFVNRREYSLQADHLMMNGKVGWYMAQEYTTDPSTGERIKGSRRQLDNATIRKHINGDNTINLYAVDPETQRSKWVAVDGDYDGSIKDILCLRYELSQDGIYPALEYSRRGAHLWVFAETPLLASELRIYIYNLALRLGIAIKGGGIKQGLEVFPLQDTVSASHFGNALRAPLGVHRRIRRRYWFTGANSNPEDQMRYLMKLPKLREDHLKTLVDGMSLPETYQPPSPAIVPAYRPPNTPGARPEFRILDHIHRTRRSGRNYWAQCPSCSQASRDSSKDNLSIQIADPRFYKCWAGCTKEDIRLALGQPLPRRTFA